MGTVRSTMIGLAVLCAAAACGDQSSAASGKQPRLIDYTGTFEESAFRFELDVPLPQDSHGAAAVEAPEGWDLRIVWSSGSCRPAPTVEVRGSEGQISSIEVDPGPKIAPEWADTCTDDEQHHVVDLKTSVEPPAEIEVVRKYRPGLAY